ncbi:MAG: hypothetical protein K6E40_08845 [Desulfovibrio sp.]|nr:hypothetical protein [Desulfovibrio sp.]
MMRDRAMFPLCVNSHHCLGKAAVNEKPRVGRQKFCDSGFPQLKDVFISVLLAGAVAPFCTLASRIEKRLFFISSDFQTPDKHRSAFRMKRQHPPLPPAFLAIPRQKPASR